jgi:hypothetical protein
MVDLQKVIAQINSPSLRKIVLSLFTFFNNLIDLFCVNTKDESGKKIQLIAQRIDGKKVPVNRKL